MSQTTQESETQEYRVNVWMEVEADVDVEAASEEEAIEKAKEHVKAGAATMSTPTEDEVLSASAYER